MNLQIEILLVLSAFGLVSFIAAVFCIKNLRQLKNLSESNNDLIFHLENALSEFETELAESRRQIDLQTKLINSLETRIRVAEVTEKKIPQTAKLNRTETAQFSRQEQKHKVLNLAGHGQDSRAIAETLGMMPGEVELIVNLNRPQFSYA